MFPTFTQLTTRHPRYFSVMGLCVFMLGILLWLGYSYSNNTTITQETTPTQQTEEDILREQFAILDSLKSTESVTQTKEEQEEILSSLMPKDVEGGTVEEQSQIVESLRNN